MLTVPPSSQKVSATLIISPKEYALIQEVKRRLGFVASSSLECVLLKETSRFVGLSAGEIDFIRQMAESAEITLPI